MCDNENLKKDRLRCEACRTINLALHAKYPKPSMQVVDKCTPRPGTCINVSELPVHPTCIKVCDKDEYNLRKGATRIPVTKPPVGHGPLMYGVKAGLLLGAVYFTYSQGVWGDQEDVTECIRRWQAYIKSFHTRRPPTFDACGRVVMRETSDSVVAPLYSMYKEFITTCFSGIAKFPLICKCMYIDYLKAMERREDELAKERKLKKK